MPMYKATLTVPGNAAVTLTFANSDMRSAFMDCIKYPARAHGATIEPTRQELNGQRLPDSLLEMMRRDYMRIGDKVAIIKTVRELTQAGLKEAKDFCDEFIFP